MRVRPPTRRPSEPRLRSARARRAPVVLTSLAAVAGLLATGCGGGDRPAARPSPSADAVPLLQSAAEPGPHPFTASTVLTADRSATRTPPPPSASAGPANRAAAQAGPRTVDGATPGLYGGTHSLPSCDVDQQARFLAADQAKARAFAQAAGVTPRGLGAWLRGLTPVMLRADTRVTGHGYRDGAALPYQAVLQAGTAVLVDSYGAPRVRCAAGNPLRNPADAPPPTAYRGEPWPGFRPERVVLITPTQRTLDSLLLVNVFNDTWLERKAGSRGDEDRKPAVPPAYEAARHVADAPVPDAAHAGPAARPAGPGAAPGSPSPAVPPPPPSAARPPAAEAEPPPAAPEQPPAPEPAGPGEPDAGPEPAVPDAHPEGDAPALDEPSGGDVLYGPLPDPAAGE
ncbi:hypothetical protein SUDANB38_05420 [Streptomyces sp. enrichment culture]